MSIIDSHCHILSDDESSYPRSPLGGKESVWAKDRPVTAEGLLERMDRVGIDKAVLVQATTAYGYDNSYVLDSAKRHSDRFTAVGTFDPLADHAGDRLKAGIESGLSGVRLFTTGSTVSEQGMWFAEESTYEFWEVASSASIPVCLQLRLDEKTSPVLAQLLHRFPNATVLLDHCGYPAVQDSLADAAASLTALSSNAGLHLKLTHRTLEGLDQAGDKATEFLLPVIDAFGADRIAWGSNCPAAEQPLSELLGLANRVLGALTTDTRADILENTAARLYPALG